MFTCNNRDSYPQLLPPSFHIPSLIHPFNLLLHQQPCLQDGHSLQPASAPTAATTAGAVNMVVSAKAALDNQSISNMNKKDYDPFGLTHTKKRKDRHSKIVTAQGPRDRRVRLSIEISRKFFALQDMLGFDKGSKTLDWLLNKSKTAISDLVQMKHGGGSSTSEYELLLGTHGVATAGDSHRMVSRNGKNKRQIFKTVQLLARESRAKARARARERTTAKMIAKKTKEPKMLSQSHHSSSPTMPNQSKCLNQSETCRKLISDPQIHCRFPFLTVDADTSEPSFHQQLVTDESVVQRMFKTSPICDFHQQSSILSSDLNYNTINFNPPSTLENWGIHTSSITYQGFSAMSNMYPSAVLQICSKPWEIYKINKE